MQSLTTFDNTNQPLPDFWILLRTVLERIRSWYMHRIRSSTEEAAAARDADILPLGPEQVFANGNKPLASAEAVLSPVTEPCGNGQNDERSRKSVSGIQFV